MITNSFISCQRNINTGTIQFIQIDTISVPEFEELTFSSLKNLTTSRLCEVEDTLYHHFLDYNNKNLILFNLRSKKYSKIHLSQLNLDTNQSLHDVYYKIYNKDSIIFHLNNLNEFVFTDFSGKVLKIISGSKKNIINENTLAFFNYSFEYFNNKLNILCAYNDIVLESSLELKKYYSRPTQTIINCSGTSPKYSKGVYFPENYQEGNLYGDTYHNFCINNKGESLFSFSADKYIYLYKDTVFLKKILANSNSNEEFTPYDLKLHRGDMNFKRTYFINEPCYGDIIFDKYNKLYYRVYKFKVKEQKDKIKRPQANDIPWSIIVLNSEFIKIGEIIFDDSIYNSSVIFPSSKGLIISKNKTEFDSDRKNNYEYGLFKIETNH